MSKAFLSHSWADKELVRSVAHDLGRQFCIFDEQAFDTSITFKQSIEKYLDESSIFVLFASSNSLKSLWVDFEITEAWYQYISKKLTKIIVFIIDTSIKPADLPPWLNRAKIMSTNSAKVITREIRYHIDKELMGEQNKYFEGRTIELEKFQSMMTPIGKPAPRVASIYGLPHIGRRTFLAHAANLTLAFNRLLIIAISDGDELVDITVKLATQMEPYSTKDGFEYIIKTIRSESEDALTNRITKNLTAAIANKELPVIMDDGGIFTSDGFLKQPIRTIMANVVEKNDIYLFIVTNRRPSEIEFSLSLNSLPTENIKRLVYKAATDSGISLTSSQVSELSEYINGFPPSVYYAVQLLKIYGVDALLAEKHKLVQFRVSFFIDILNKYFFNPIDKKILNILGKYSPIPINTLVDVLMVESQQVASSIIKLIEHSLVVTNEYGLYAISEPISDSVISLFREHGDVDHAEIHKSLSKYLNENNDELPRLDLMRLLFKAAARSGKTFENNFHMANDLIKLAEDYYHQRDYKQCIRFAELSLLEVSNNENATELLIRSFIQDEQWDAALDKIESYSRYAVKRNIFFLKGFYHRKRGELDDAIQYFLESEKYGRGGVAVKRELAMCYYLNNQIPESKRYVLDAMNRNETKYVVDLFIQIATREGDEQQARDGLNKLEKLDTESFVQHRLSTVELRFGNIPAALDAARKAVSSFKGERPPFGILSQLATCYTRAGDFQKAEDVINRLSKQFDNKRNDIRLGLECRLEIEKGYYALALNILSKIKNKSQLVYRTMERDAISGELKGSVLTDEQRINYMERLRNLNIELDTKDVINSWMELIS